MKDRTNSRIINDYTRGNMAKQMLAFSLPFMISNSLQVLYSVVDMVVVGNVMGGAGLSAVSTASMVMNFLTMICVGLATGAQVLISQIVGSGAKERLSPTIGTEFTLSLAVALILTAVTFIFQTPVLDMLQTPEESYGFARDYLLICAGGLVFTYGYNVVSAVLRGMGNSKQPCIFIVIAAIVNLILDVVFVLFLGMGVAGAALATVAGQAVSLIWSLVYLVRRKEEFGFDFKPKSFVPEKKALAALTRLGVPFALRSAAVNVSMIFVTSMVNGVSLEASAVYGIGLKVDDVVNKISMGVNYSVSTIVGQNFAAGNFSRVKKSVYWGWLYAFAVYAAFTVVYLTNIYGMFRIFTSDESVLSLAPVFVSALVWCFPAMIIMRGTNGFIQGIGNTTLSLVFSLLDGLVLRIGLTWLLGIVCDLGLFGFFLGFGLATYGTALPGMIYFFSGVWKKRKALQSKSAA